MVMVMHEKVLEFKWCRMAPQTHGATCFPALCPCRGLETVLLCSWPRKSLEQREGAVWEAGAM